ncbi:MAG: hypothetical protein ACK55G_22415, partial [Dolichospermum sp.]
MILFILIWLTPRYAIRQLQHSPPTNKRAITSCTSSNPGHPDSDNYNIHHQKNQSSFIKIV